MDSWIDVARGPLFRISLAICLLGLAYRLGNAIWQIGTSYGRAGDKQLPGGTILKATLQRVFPLRLWRLRPVYGLASLAFHAGILLIPLFSVGHVTLWAGSLPFAWPVLGATLSDLLSLLAMAGLATILLERLLVSASRDLTSKGDVGLLAVLLLLTASGYLAAHPATAPFAPRALLLAHMLLGNLALILTPTTKIVHCVLAPLTQLISEIGWHFPAESGRHVAIALAKEDEPI